MGESQLQTETGETQLQTETGETQLQTKTGEIQTQTETGEHEQQNASKLIEMTETHITYYSPLDSRAFLICISLGKETNTYTDRNRHRLKQA